MKRNLLTLLIVAGILSLGVITCLPTLSQEGQIGGNSAMLPAPSAYTVVALPQNYQQDPLSQKFLAELASDNNLRQIRSQTETRTYLAGHPILENMRIETTPALVVMDGEQVLYKTSGEGVLNAGAELEGRGITRHCFKMPAVRICPQCPLQRPIIERPNQPKNDPDDPKRKEPELPNTPPLQLPLPLQPATPAETHFVLLAAIVGAVGAFARYFRD